MVPSSPFRGHGSGIRAGGDSPIRFRPLPLRIIVAGRFGLAPQQLHRLDSAGAGGLLQRTAPSLALRVADRLRDDGTELTVRLGFRHRRDFAPGVIAREVPDLMRLVSAHDALRNGVAPATLRDGFTDFPAVHAALSGATPAVPDDRDAAPPPASRPAAAEGAGDDGLDRLLDMVDTPASGPAEADRGDPVRNALSGFIAQVSRGSGRRSAGAGAPPEALETAIAGQIEPILAHPEYAALERAWAALRFLARRIDMRAVAVDVIEAGPDTLADALQALVPEDDPDPSGPVRLVVDINDYDASDRDIARLRRLAGFGASRRAVVLVNADPGFAGEPGPAALAGMHDPETLFDTDRYAGWRTLRDDADADWLGLCLSRIALRDAVDGRDDGVLKFLQSRRIGRPLGLGVAPAIAALVATAAVETEWACAVGTAVDPVVDNLVLVHDPETGFDGPVCPAPSAGAADSLASAGLIALVPERGRDTIRLLHAAAVHRPAGRGNRADRSLMTRLFQAQVVHGLQWNADRLFTTADHAELRDRVEACLTALVSGTGPGAGAEVRLTRDQDGVAVLAVHVRSGARAAPGAAMAFDIPLDTGKTASGAEA